MAREHDIKHPDGRECSKVTLVRGRHRWRFECATGDLRVLDLALANLAARCEVPLDHVDAAIVRQQMDRSLAAGLYQHTPPNAMGAPGAARPE